MQLLEGNPGDFAGVITPHHEQLVSGVNLTAWLHYKDESGLEWLKHGSLWKANGELVHEQTIRLDMGAVTWAWLLSLESEACRVTPSPIAIVANGDVSLGQTDRINVSAGANYGLANSGHDSQDACNQPSDNLINDPDKVLHRLDQGDTLNAIRHLFSSVHASVGADASRCQFACWNADNFGGYYDGFTWLVR